MAGLKPATFFFIYSYDKEFMAKTLVARGQATITVQKDGYTITQSLSEYVFPADQNGKILSAVSVTSMIRVSLGDNDFTAFTLGTVSKPAGFSAVTVDNTRKSVTFAVAANTTTLAEHGTISIPVVISGVTYTLSFSWSKARAGAPGSAGADANLLDWVKDWNSQKTVIDSNTVITPKIFAGTKNSDGTISGVAIGIFPLSTKTASGTITTETVTGVYGFKDGYKTFAVDNGGNVQLGYGDEIVKYNASTGKIEFGAGVSLNWTNAISQAKNEAISAAASDATDKVNALRIGIRNYIRNSAFEEALSGVSTDGTTVSIDSVNFYSGYNTLKVVQTTACTDANANTQRTYFTAIGSKICTPASFSMYVKASVAGTLKIRIGGTGIQSKTVTTSWQRITIENITPTSAVVLFGFSVAATFWCALPMLVEGSKAADWSRAPEDLASRIADAKKAGTDARSVADAITSQANTEGWATKLTYIDKSGIFTGTLSANTVQAIQINASQITAGIIATDRLDTAALKSVLVTASNIEALTLNVIRGKIGGWNIDSDSIYRGTKNNTSGGYAAASGSITIGSAGIRGYKWKLDATGAGAVAGGNIAWDAAGNVTFGASVALNWTNAADTAAAKGRLHVRGTGMNHSANRLVELNGKVILNGTGRGLNLLVINRNSLAVLSNKTYDVYGSDANCNTLATDLNALASDKIVILTSYDAIRINATLNTAIQRCGGSDYTVTDLCAPYALVGIPGIGKNNGLLSLFGTDASDPYAELSTTIVGGIPQGICIDGKRSTYISGSGVYTGSINASQITAGTISADRIAAGSINSSKLDAASIKANIINVSYINGLSCTFTQGKIGGWTIGTSSITASHVAIDSGSKRIAVYGASSSPTSGKRVQLYYNSDTDFGLWASDASGNCIVSLGASNKIGGWVIAPETISKGNVSLGSDGSITNGTKWKLNNDGSGQIASGNISWNAAGNVTFSSAVALNWKNDIEAAKSTNYGYRYYKKIVINGDADKYYPVVFKGGDQTVKRDILVRRDYSEQAPDSWNTATHKGGLILLVKANFGGWGGASYSWEIYELSECYCRMFAGAVHCGNYCMFALFLRGGGTTGAVYHLYSDQPIESTHMSPSPIPAAPQIAYSNDLIFQSGSTTAYAPAPRTLTASVEDEIRRKQFITLAQSNDSTLTAHPLTYIGSTGIYTGTLTAAQVNAVNISASSIQSGTLSADRIAAGSINATKLDAASIKANIINTSYINGLSCTFTQGKIGGFTITGDSMNAGSIGATGAVPLQIRSSSTGSGYWYTGAYKPLGITLTWYQDSNAGHIVMGQVAASGSTVKTGFIGLQMMSWDGLEYFCLSANYTKSGSKEVYNRIAGWAFDHNHIWKNNISLSADGSITNGTKWKLNNDGSGQIASGNVSWDASGTVTFAASVSAQWTTGITNAKELASAMAFGKMLYRDPTFWEGNNSVAVYNNSSNGMVVITRAQDSTAPNDSKYVLKIQTNGTASPGNGGFGFGTTCSYRKVLIARIIAKIPKGRNLCWASNSIGSDGSSRWLTETAGTGDWQEYIHKVVCGTSGFSSTHFFYVDGTQGTSSAPVVWYVAYATVFDLTSSEKYTTTIDANGIYTGTVRANQVLVDSALVVGGSTYNGSISVRDANNNVKVTLDRTGITAVAGKIGGWVLGTSSLTASAPSSGHRIVIGGSGYIYHDNPSTGKNYWALKTDGSAIFGTGKISFANDGSGFVANGNFKWDANGNITAQKGTFKDVEVIGTIRNAFILSDSSIYIGGTDPQLNLNKYNNVVAIRGSWDEDIPLPWTLEQSGRRVCLVNYKWGSSTTVGTMSITAPSGKYFYEDGIAKSTISFSREVIELLGYGDNATFFGWIVVNRLDIMTTKKYGSVCKFLVMGTVTVSSTSSISVKYRTFDGSTISVSRLGKGQYRVYMPSSWGLSGYYTVFLSGIYSTLENASIYATLKATYSYYFDVYTQDDSTRNDGSFNFMVVSTGDWK